MKEQSPPARFGPRKERSQAGFRARSVNVISTARLLVAAMRDAAYLRVPCRSVEHAVSMIPRAFC